VLAKKKSPKRAINIYMGCTCEKGNLSNEDDDNTYIIKVFIVNLII